jgi:diguanylate cyclase (GGDEF)-like protein
MSEIYVDEMFVGEAAEIMSISDAFPEYRQLRTMGFREGRLVDLLHFDPLITGKLVLRVEGMRLALGASCAAHIRVRPLKSAYLHLRDMAHYDKLTGCFNRHAAGTVVRQEVERFSSLGLPLALLMADLDHFKRINDTYGHTSGDDVLKSFATLIREGLRRSDLFCRWGGEEFLILLRGTLKEEALRIAERFRVRIASALFPPFSERGAVTVSIGCACLPPGRPLERLIVDADCALYRAKQGGRNRVCLC